MAKSVTVAPLILEAHMKDGSVIEYRDVIQVDVDTAGVKVKPEDDPEAYIYDKHKPGERTYTITTRTGTTVLEGKFVRSLIQRGGVSSWT